MGFMDQVRGFFGGDIDELDDEMMDYADDTGADDEGYAAPPKGNAVPMKAKIRGRIVVKTPESFEDGKIIADLLKQRNSVVFNLELLSREEGSRLIDFLMGASYMSDSELKYTGNMTFLIAPRDVDVVVQVPAAEQDNPDFFT